MSLTTCCNRLVALQHGVGNTDRAE